jgi:ABC-type multidrug transport system fused ATPase/permease subunit
MVQPILRALASDLQPVAHVPTGNRADAPTLSESLSLVSVSYRYPGASTDSVSDLTLSIPANQTVAFVGPSGAGKSTTADILLGLLEPTSGTVAIDGEPMTAARMRAWRGRIGYVPQSIFLVDGSVAQNIAFAIPDEHIDHSAVERAARLANLHDFIVKELPYGYSTEVGERGVRLSGGQRQRIGIARALYYDPVLLVMDEATSALDTLTEHAVMDAVRTLSHRKTIILIAHRLSTVRECDCIYVLERGRLTGAGTFSELVATHDHFRALADIG